MQMTGQQRIAVPRERVWEALYDPEILTRCIPGCQSLTQESSERMRATVDVKIGPIGARFNGTVAFSDIDRPNSCTLTMDGRGGTVGFVKNSVKVRLDNDSTTGTVLLYEVDAQIGGRLAQLGGPLIDATARQLAGKFFHQFGAVLGESAGAAVDGAAADASGGAAGSAGGAVGASPAGAVATTARASSRLSDMAGASVRVSPEAARGFPAAWILAVAVAALVGYLIGHASRSGESDWMGLAIGLLLIIVAAVSFEHGRRVGGGGR